MSKTIAIPQRDNDNGLGMSPDGKWFVYAAARSSGQLMMVENFR